MATHDVDVVVLGLGPGGEHAAIKLARAGLTVVGIEDRLVGGECPYFGCVPTKMMIAASQTLGEAHRVTGLAGTAEVRPDWSLVADRIRDEATSDWDDAAAVERLEENGARFVRGRGRLVGPGRVEVGQETYVASRGVVLNTGTSPAVPPVPGLAGTPYWTNRDLVRATSLPDSMVVVGGGAIGCEMAQVVSRFGTDVTIVEMADRLIPGDEPEAAQVLADAFAADGMRVVTGAEIASVGYDEGRFTLDLGDRELAADRVLVAAGRTLNLADTGLESVGLDPDVDAIATDEWLRAGDRLWAVGDITGHGMFTHVSMYQAAVVVRDVLGSGGPAADYRAVSRVTYTDPEVAAVGLTEAAAREQGLSVVTATGDLGARGWMAKQDGVVKLVADRDRGHLVGATVAGASAGEIVGMLVTAVHAEVPLARLRSMHFAYPTYHRAIETVLDDLESD